MNTNFKMRCAAIILIAAGYGWAGGHYIPSNSNVLAYLFQFIIIGILLLLGINYFIQSGIEGQKRAWAATGLSIFSVLSFIINILNVVHGAFNKDPHSFGSHNTFSDLVPIVILLLGTGLWIITIMPFRRKIQ
jgi:hypothetical protein